MSQSLKTLNSFLFLFIYTLTTYGQGNYSSLHHYSFAIPKDWRLIPPTLFKSEIKNSGLESVGYESGLQLKRGKSDDLAYPYIFLQYVPVGMDMDSVDFKKISAKIQAKFQQEVSYYNSSEIDTNNIKLITAEKIHSDFDQQSISQELYVRVKKDKNIKVLKKAYVGRFGILYFNFFCLKDEFKALKPDIESIDDSFNFDPGYKHNSPSEANKKMSAWLKLTLALIFSTAVYLVIRYFKF